jgi:hypothetical protein
VAGPVAQDGGQRPRILEAEVDAVAGKRMDGVCGVADQGQARRHRSAARASGAGEAGGRRDQFQRAQALVAGLGNRSHSSA